MNKENKNNFSGTVPLPDTKEYIFYEFLKNFDESKSFIGFDSKTIINLLLNYDNDEFIAYLLLHTMWKGQQTTEINSFWLSQLLGWNRSKISKVFNKMEQDKLIEFKSSTKGYKITCLQDFRRNRADNCEIPIGQFPQDFCHECFKMLNKTSDDIEPPETEHAGNNEKSENINAKSQQKPQPKPQSISITSEHPSKISVIYTTELKEKFPKFWESIEQLQKKLENKNISLDTLLNWQKTVILKYAQEYNVYSEDKETDFSNFFKYREQFKNEKILLK